MQSTRRLFSAASAKSIIPPRTPVDTWSSAIQACVSLLNQRSRDSFLKTVNKGIIDPAVLGRVDGGVTATLALFHDLNSPHFQESNSFDVEEFMEGVGSALQNYEDVLTSLESRDVITTEGLGDGVKKRDWKSAAKKSLDSMEKQLLDMVSSECFNALESEQRRMLTHGNNRMYYEPETSDVKNVTLLSVRAVEMAEEDEADEERSRDDVDDDFAEDISFSDGSEKKSPIIAEMEVLYTVAQTFTAKPMFSTEDKKGQKGKKQTISCAWVGVFEGLIGGEVNDSLQWKLVKNRPALEFGSFGLT